MRKTLLLVSLFLGILHSQAQEQVMNIWKTDGTSTQTRVADLKQISFLRVDGANQGMQVKTLGGETVAVLFETEPIVTVASGTLVIKPDSTEALEIEISDIAEIRFGDMPNSITSSQAKTLSCIMQDDGALISGISKGITPRVYSTDGRRLPVPPVSNGQLRLDRSTLGTGIFIVKVGSLSTKIML